MVNKAKHSEHAVTYTVLGVVAVIAILSLLLLFSTSFNAAGKISLVAKFSPGEIVQTSECNIPRTITDLVSQRSKRQNLPVGLDSCPFLVQEYCVNQNSGRCLQECLAVQQSPEGVCRGIGASITARVILNFEECRRLAESFARTSQEALQTVGAVPKTSEVFNACTGTTDQARTLVYSLSSPIQAYARNQFSTGDVTGLYANEQKGVDALEYSLCADGRAHVTVGGNERCSTIE